MNSPAILDSGLLWEGGWEQTKSLHILDLYSVHIGVILGIYWGYIGYILGLYWVNPVLGSPESGPEKYNEAGPIKANSLETFGWQSRGGSR